MTRLLCLLPLLGACTRVEPLDLPDDPSITGVPVGVHTEAIDGLTVEVWYPASNHVQYEPGEAIDFRQFVPADVADALGSYELPPIPTIAVRDAPARHTGAPLPVVLFSHGFGATRLQSPNFTTHLASRGYVVVAADHAGRSMPDLLPCLFSPPLDGCNLDFGGADPAVDDVETLFDVLDQWNTRPGGRFEGMLNLDEVGLAGHSAGGGTVATVANTDPRVKAVLPMAAPSTVTADVPALRLDGSCDGIVPLDSVEQGQAQSTGDLLVVQGAGHLAFSDLCTLDLGGFAVTYLDGRDDVNQLLLAQLVALGTDGCPGAVPPQPRPECQDMFLPLQISTPIIRHYATVFFDDALKGEGMGVTPGVYPHGVLAPSR